MRGTLARTGLPSPVSGTAYDAANRLTQWGTVALTYDANGNLLGDGANSYSWDVRDRLASLSGGNAATFQYDALGRRIQKTISGVATAFLYDGNNPAQEVSGGIWRYSACEPAAWPCC